MPKVIDLTSKRFGKLIVISISHKDKNRNYYWVCQCDCGSPTKVILGDHLKSGKIISCGCYRKENLLNINKKYNTYDLSGDYGIGYTSNDEEFYFDLDDYKLIKDYCWTTDSKGYLIAKIDDKNERLHRFLMQPDENNTVDHIDRNKKNNRRYNLRICTMAENDYNTSIQKRNKTGYIGVGFDEDGGYVAYIGYKYKKIHLGNFYNIEDAIITRLKAEKEYFGEEFAPQRHLFKQYGI